ncbi:duf1680 domain containing protein [Purpureocillium lavendulum]|uniref:Duf1680 domain containing protein n=1 Tax=Purpureocillium lavendulum TaxID=1247861 RepID=A0AB34FSE1_9HYPO|nr:duf1680 domain containing protein [Purpureocillium lavendulum]
MLAALDEITALLGEDNVSTDRENLISHSGSDFQSYPFSRATAKTSVFIAYPETTEHVSQIARICHRRRIPITPYSGGTSIEGATMPTCGGICIDFQRMTSVQVNAADLDCVVQPGVGWEDLNERLETQGLFFPPDPGPGAMIGGMIGTGCSGTNAASYGTMKDWVLSLTVVLADGTVVRTRQRPRKSSAGYDLTRLYVGSEGTLGLVTEATLKLAVKPAHQIVAVSTFKTIRDAASAVQNILAAGIQFTAIEILDDVQMRSINEAQLTKLRWDEAPTLFFRFASDSQEGALHHSQAAQAIAARHRSTSYTLAVSKDEQAELWSARKAALWSMMALRQAPTDRVWTTDVAVPLSRLPEIIEWTKREISSSEIVGSIVGHVADGNFHALLLFDEEKRFVAEKIVHRMVEKALSLEGTATGEHGVGLVKRDYLHKELGQPTVDLMRKVKHSDHTRTLKNNDMDDVDTADNRSRLRWTLSVC